jgi:dihydroorotate dehydrogenase
MMAGARWRRPWLWLPSQLAHDLAPLGLPLISKFCPVKDKSWRPLDWRQLIFDNPLGLAGGVDKNGVSIGSWLSLGAGFVEVGTVTPEPQGPNPGLIMARDLAHQALWNKMGFPNNGVKALAKQLASIGPLSAPLFVNVGKNRWTKNEQAYQDYGHCIRQLSSFADGFVVNLSSPNTQGLRDLLNAKELHNFLEQLRHSCQGSDGGKPYLLKLSPDMDGETLTMALETSAPWVDGWILTNTTKERAPGLAFPPDEGGVSGQPLAPLSLRALTVAAQAKDKYKDKLLVSVGGISSAQDILTRLQLGADLVQFYSALVFQGPLFFRRVIKELQLLESDSGSSHDRAIDL